MDLRPSQLVPGGRQGFIQPTRIVADSSTAGLTLLLLVITVPIMWPCCLIRLVRAASTTGPDSFDQGGNTKFGPEQFIDMGPAKGRGKATRTHLPNQRKKGQRPLRKSVCATRDHRDGLVNGTGQITTRNNQANPLTMLRLITAPALDAAIQQTSQDTPQAISVALDRQHEFESTQSKAAKRKDVEATVDLLLATDWQ